MFDILHGYEIKAYSNAQEILGVDSIEISTRSPNSIQRLLGSSHAAIIATDTPDQTVSISRYLVGIDTLLQYTGNSAFALSVHHNDIVHTFQSGYLNQYGINCAIGSVPKVSTNFQVFDEIIKTTGIAESGSGVQTSYVPQQGSIICTCDHYATNRIVGFDVGISMSREPIYVIGRQTPIEVVQNAGLLFSASVQIDVDDAFLASGLAFLDERENKTVSLVVKNKQKTIDLVNIAIPNASLIDQGLSASADGGLKLTLTYQGHS